MKSLTDTEFENLKLAVTLSKLLYTKKEAAAALSISVRTLDSMISRKELVSRKIGARRLVPRSALEAFARRDHATQVNGHE